MGIRASGFAHVEKRSVKKSAGSLARSSIEAECHLAGDPFVVVERRRRARVHHSGASTRSSLERDAAARVGRAGGGHGCHGDGHETLRPAWEWRPCCAQTFSSFTPVVEVARGVIRGSTIPPPHPRQAPPVNARPTPSEGGKSPYNARIQKGPNDAYGGGRTKGRHPPTKTPSRPTPTTPSLYTFSAKAQLAAGALAEADREYGKGRNYRGCQDDLHAKCSSYCRLAREDRASGPDGKKAWDDYTQILSEHPTSKDTCHQRPPSCNKVSDTHVALDAKYKRGQ